MKGFPLLDLQCKQEIMRPLEEDAAYLRLSGPFLDFATPDDSIKGKTSILIDRRESVQIQVAVALARNGLRHREGWRGKELGI